MCDFTNINSAFCTVGRNDRSELDDLTFYYRKIQLAKIRFYGNDYWLVQGADKE
jgi:hypothetical protein